MKYKRRYTDVVAKQLTVDNLYEIESWCRGSVKGTKLPIEQREIDFYRNGEEITAEINDWIVNDDGYFYVYSDEVFHAVFEPTQ